MAGPEKNFVVDFVRISTNRLLTIAQRFNAGPSRINRKIPAGTKELCLPSLKGLGALTNR